MEKIKKASLQIKNNSLSGGFTTLNDSQISKIKGGIKNLLDDNALCQNENDCTSTTNTGHCSNTGTC